MGWRLKSIALLLLSGLISACGGSSSDGTPEPPPVQGSAELRIHHAVSDGPSVNIVADGTVEIEAAEFGQSSEVLEADAATYSIQVDGILPDQSTTTVIGPLDLTLVADQRYEVIALGKLGDESIDTLVVSNPISAVSSGSGRVQLIHAAPDAPIVDIYITAVEADLTSETPAATLAFTDASDQLEFTAGEYQVRVTPAGEPNTVVFDTGAITIEDGDDVAVLAIPNTRTGESPIMLQVADTLGETDIVMDIDAGVDVRVVHTVADLGAVDFVASDITVPELTELNFGEFTSYRNFPAGDYLVDVKDSQTGTVLLNDIPLTAELGEFYSFYALGANADNSVTTGFTVETPRRIATAAKLQLVHAAPAAGTVDIYIGSSNDISDQTPAYSDVAFTTTNGPATTGYVELLPGNYSVVIAQAGTKDVLFDSDGISLSASGLYTIALVDSLNGGLPIQAIAIEGFSVR